MAKYGDSYAFRGSYVMSKEFKGKGYGHDATMAGVKHFPRLLKTDTRLAH